MVFLGITPDNEATAGAFCRRHNVAWPIGWGAKKFLDEWILGGYPALFVIGRDGRICWNDGGARYHHAEGELRDRLSRQIRQAL